MVGNTKSENVKKIAAAAFGVIFVLVLAYQLFFSAPTPKPRLPAGSSGLGQTSRTVPQTTVSPAGTAKNVPASAAQEALLLAQLNDTTPLNLAYARGPGNSKPGERGNIFAYYVAPPAPPAPPPPPPPVILNSVTPASAVASSPHNITLTIRGTKIPPDAQVYYDNSPRPTKRVSENELSIELNAGDYGVPRTFNIEVKSKSDPARLYSNALQFVAQPPPDSGVIYKGRLGDLNQPDSLYAVFEIASSREIKRMRRGELLLGVWRIDSVGKDSVDLTHSQYGIKRRVPLQERPR